jgi:RNA polymerase sigma-70 factor (ECF subfamily)
MEQRQSEPALIEKARAGSAEAFADLVRLHQAAVRGYVGKYLRGRSVVDDVAQEIFLACYHSLPSFQGESLRFWLLGIARRRVALFLREELRRRAHEMGALESGLLERQAAMVEADEAGLPYHEREMAALRACVRRLSSDEARLIDAYYLRTQSAAKIAERLGKSDAAVRMALMRLRQALPSCVERRLAGGAAGETV